MDTQTKAANYLRAIDLVDEALKVGYPDSTQGEALVAQAAALDTPMLNARELADKLAKRGR